MATFTKSYVMFNTFIGLPDWHGAGGRTCSQRNGDTIINWQAVTPGRQESPRAHSRGILRSTVS